MKLFNILKALSNNATDLSNRVTALENKDIFPVGSIYMSINNTNPGTLFGGTWEQIQDKFLLSAGSTYTAGNTGGTATVSLAEGNLPSHRHSWPRAVGMYGTKSETGLSYVQIGFYNSGASDGLFFSDRFTDTNKRYTSYTGSGTAHDNMPPYLVVYVWKRTA